MYSPLKRPLQKMNRSSQKRVTVSHIRNEFRTFHVRSSCLSWIWQSFFSFRDACYKLVLKCSSAGED